MADRLTQAKSFEGLTSGRRAYWNLIVAIRRRQRTLQNSMAHVRRPRPADFARWRAMEAELEHMNAQARRLRPDRHPEPPDASA